MSWFTQREIAPSILSANFARLGAGVVRVVSVEELPHESKL